MAKSPVAACPACGKQFPWKPELAGRRVKCTCDNVFAIPDTPMEPEPLPLGQDDFELNEPRPEPQGEVKCPSCNLTMKAAAVICLNCGFNRESGGKVKTAVVAAAAAVVEAEVATADAEANPLARGRSAIAEALEAREDDQGIRPFRDYYLPAIFLIAGIGFTMFNAMNEGKTLAIALVEVGVYLLVYVPLMLAAVTITANLMGISYGPLLLGLLKLAAIAFGPLALADYLIAYLASLTMGFGTFFISLPIYAVVTGIPVSQMFDLEINETFMTVAVIIVLRIIFGLTLLALIVGLFR